MKFFQKASDGGKNSGVTGFFIVEIKSLFSIVLLHFKNGTREAFHSHAFNAVTLWLSGRVREHIYDRTGQTEPREWRAGQWKFTGREDTHKVESIGNSWALSFRGPWIDRWKEFKNGMMVTLTHGRRVVS